MDAERLAELRRQCTGATWPRLSYSETVDLLATAERYLYLRSGFNDVLPVCDESGEWVYGETLDAAIDAAMKGGES